MLCCCCYDGLIVDRCLSYIQYTLLQERAHTTGPGKYSRVRHSHWTGHERRQHFGDYHSKKEMGEGGREGGRWVSGGMWEHLASVKGCR